MRRALCVVLVALAGCKSQHAPTIATEPLVDYSGGFFLELWVLADENFAVIYHVNGDKEVGWGGGQNAINRRLSWTGAMTDDQYEQLQGLLNEHGWFDKSIASTGEPKTTVSRIRLRWNGGSRRYTKKGVSDDIEPVQTLLEEIARQRLHTDLDALPQPSREEGGESADPGGL